MAIQFGLGSLSILENRGIDVVVGDLSGSASTMTAGADRSVMIDGVTAIWSAQTISVTALLTTGLGATGVGLLYYVYLSAGDTITSTVALATAADPINTSTNIPTAICPLYRFNFGNGANAVSAISLVSGGSATKTIAKVQNVSINVAYEQTQMRGGGDIFPVDTQFQDGSVEGSFEFADQTATQLQFFGGLYASGGSSGTWTLSGTSRPNAVSLVFQNVTNGVTLTYTMLRSYLMQSTNYFSRTEYMNPSYSFVSQTNNQGSILTIQQ